MKKNSFSKNTLYLKLIRACTLVIFMLVSCSQKSNTPSGKIIPWDDVGDLRTRSYSNLDARKNDIELSIKTLTPKIEVDDSMCIEILLKNKTKKDIVVYNLDAMPVYGEANNFPFGIEIILMSAESNIRLVAESYLDLPQFLSPPPENFSTLPARGSQSLSLSLSSVFRSIPVGVYSVQVVYKNEGEFGAVVYTESDTYFLDYDAWLGTTLSNIEIFQVAP